MPYISVKPSCSIENCDRTVECRGWCGLHYSRWRRYGDPLKTSGRFYAPRWKETDDLENSKVCPKCKVRLPREAFQKQTKRPDGLNTQCKNCYRDWYNKRYAEDIEFRAKRKEFQRRDLEKHEAKRRESRNAARYYRMYGITFEQYNEMSVAQNGACAICKRQPYADHPDPRKKKLATDHDHATRKVRGLLCDTCNTGLGMFKDDPELLLAAIDYLRKHQSS